jgi:hypothetical protein
MPSEPSATHSTPLASYYRWLFITAAIWNLLAAAAVALLLGDARFRQGMGFPGPADTISLQLLAACLLVFGLGYYWVSGDLSGNRDLVKLGVIGKPLVFLVFLGHAVMKEIPVRLSLHPWWTCCLGYFFLSSCCEPAAKRSNLEGGFLRLV